MEPRHKKIIQVKAFDIFRAWTQKASRYYPKLDFTILDETVLVHDLEETILQGIKSLNEKPDKKKKRKEKGFEYEYGFMIGFIRGSLDVKWVHEYIHKNSKEYRNFTACKAILEYLKFDVEIGRRMKNIYTELMKRDTNLANIEYGINKELIKKFQLDKISRKNLYSSKNNPVYTYLENQLSKHIVDVMESTKYEIMPRLDPYFDEDFIHELILIYE